MHHWNYYEFGTYVLNKSVKTVTASEEYGLPDGCTVNSCWLQFVKQDASQIITFTEASDSYKTYKMTCPTYGQSLFMEQWTFLLMYEHLAHIAQTILWASGRELCHHTLCVCYHTPFLTWHPLIAWLSILSSPLGGGLCHTASTTSPPFCLIEIRLGTQTMPISWHQILEGAA